MKEGDLLMSIAPSGEIWFYVVVEDNGEWWRVPQLSQSNCQYMVLRDYLTARNPRPFKRVA